jgi:hypothetical protein
LTSAVLDLQEDVRRSSLRLEAKHHNIPLHFLTPAEYSDISTPNRSLDTKRLVAPNPTLSTPASDVSTLRILRVRV